MTVKQDKKVMVLVDITPGMTVMKSTYVFKIKKSFEKCSRYKARLVALGFDQEVDSQLNFAPVVKPNTVRMLMELAHARNMSIN
jgi:predicted sulfurtransferase